MFTHYRIIIRYDIIKYVNISTFIIEIKRYQKGNGLFLSFNGSY